MMPFTLLDFKFNGWGEKFRWEKDNAITQNLYYQGAFRTVRSTTIRDLCSKRGSIESDGKGTIFTTSQCLRRLIATSRSIVRSWKSS